MNRASVHRTAMIHEALVGQLRTKAVSLFFSFELFATIDRVALFVIL